MESEANRTPEEHGLEIAPWRESYLVFGAPFIGQEERVEVQACIDSLWLGSGPRVRQFEDEFSAYIGSPYAVAVSSGTAALELALKALEVEPGSEVLLPSLTFCATANAAIHNGLIPVFVDSDPRTMNIDLEDAERRITPKTRVIIPVHFAGRPCEMKPLQELADKHGLHIVEDCAHAIESTFNGRHCGTFGAFGCFSFYITKNITTIEGGMVVCKDEKLANKIKVSAFHGMSKDAWRRYSDEGHVHYQVVQDGHKFNLTDLAASFGIHQLRRVVRLQDKRRALWHYYLEELRGLPLTLPGPCREDMSHAHHLFNCLLDSENAPVSRDDLLDRMHRLSIGTGVHYLPLHQHEYYRHRYNLQDLCLPNAESIGQRTFSIPLSAAVTETDAHDVVKALRLILG